MFMVFNFIVRIRISVRIQCDLEFLLLLVLQCVFYLLFGVRLSISVFRQVISVDSMKGSLVKSLGVFGCVVIKVSDRGMVRICSQLKWLWLLWRQKWCRLMLLKVVVRKVVRVLFLWWGVEGKGMLCVFLFCCKLLEMMLVVVLWLGLVVVQLSFWCRVIFVRISCDVVVLVGVGVKVMLKDIIFVVFWGVCRVLCVGLWYKSIK